MMQAEERQFVFPSGKQAGILVSRLAPGKFRIEEYLFGPACVVDDGDIPDAAGMGWLIEVDEPADGRLQVRRMLEDPDVECLNGLLISPDFAKSLQFQIFSEAIVARGGRWELWFQGVFSAYVPKEWPDAGPFSLESHFEDAVKGWIQRRNSTYEHCEGVGRADQGLPEPPT
jgi:hypothetical protein